jgi:hypothetical protein
MTKFMDQALFDVCAIKVIEEKVSTGRDYKNLPVIEYLVESYGKDYSDSILFRGQFEEVSEKVLTKYEKHGPLLLVALGRAADKRMKLDNEMRPKDSVKGIFNGAWFQRSHPKPFDRADIAVNNISYLIEISLPQNQDESNLVVIPCSKCQQKLRVPSGRTLEITCPKCKNSWIAAT